MYILYQDFFVHSVLLLDLIATYLSDGKCEKFYDLVKFCEDTLPRYSKPILVLSHNEEILRYYRNKFFAHKGVIRTLGANRFDPARGKFEFALVNIPTGIDKGDYDGLITLRDKYVLSYPQLKKEANFWEVLKLFDNLRVPISKDDRTVILGLHKKYGALLPELKDHIKPLNALLSDIKPYLV